jgi:hypothetical protein
VIVQVGQVLSNRSVTLASLASGVLPEGRPRVTSVNTWTVTSEGSSPPPPTCTVSGAIRLVKVTDPPGSTQTSASAARPRRAARRILPVVAVPVVIPLFLLVGRRRCRPVVVSRISTRT